MNEIQPGYLLGIGSNIKPEANIAKIIQLLLSQFGKLSLSRVLKIPPVGMNSQHDFLNLAVFIETPLSEMELKACCNTIETQLGRDRADPASKVKDRPADIDILLKADNLDELNISPSLITDEYFLYPLIEEVSAYLLDNDVSIMQPGLTIKTDRLTFGQSATTINRNAHSR